MDIDYNKYLSKGYSIIPDKFASKMPAIKGWTEYCHKLPTKHEWFDWDAAFKKYNISLCLGPASQIVALDLDTDDPDILKKIEHLLPSSPVEKKGSKGYTRFFRMSPGQETEILKYNGNVILEILSTGKKTTLPPSMHPNGESYHWTSDKTLLDVNVAELPILPPMLISVLQQKLGGQMPTSTADYGKVVTGRNSALSSYLGELLAEPHSLDQVIEKLIKFDKSNHEVPYFTDANDHRHTHAVTNALSFYVSHMESFNGKRYRDGKEYVEPALATGKSKVPETPKKMPENKISEFRLAPTVVKLYNSNITEKDPKE